VPIATFVNCRHNANVVTEQLIALEGAQAELGTLYAVARTFRDLHASAEHDWLPRVSTLARHLRSLHRAGRLDPHAIDAVARDIATLRTAWRQALDAVRAAPPYQAALAALRDDQQPELVRLLPPVIFGIRPVAPPSALYFPVALAGGRRRPGQSPFPPPEEVAARIARRGEEGLVPDTTGAEWWERELVPIGCAASAQAFDTPVTLRLHTVHCPATVFAVDAGNELQVFTPRLRGSLTAVLAPEVDDEWWEAQPVAYAMYRTVLGNALRARGIAVDTDSAA
jgi:hypothetical protein